MQKITSGWSIFEPTPSYKIYRFQQCNMQEEKNQYDAMNMWFNRVNRPNTEEKEADWQGIDQNHLESRNWRGKKKKQPQALCEQRNQSMCTNRIYCDSQGQRTSTPRQTEEIWASKGHPEKGKTAFSSVKNCQRVRERRYEPQVGGWYTGNYEKRRKGRGWCRKVGKRGLDGYALGTSRTNN